MRSKYGIFLLMSFSLSVSSVYAGRVVLPAPIQNKDQLVVETFQDMGRDRIIASGYFDLRIVHDGKKSWVKTKSYAESPIDVTVNKGVLFVKASVERYLQYRQHPVVIVSLPGKLKTLEVGGPANVVTEGRDNAPENLVVNGYGSVSLHNVGAIHSVKQVGNSVIHVDGVLTPQLNATLTGFGKTVLQGKTKHLVVRLSGDASLNARQLAAQSVLVQAKHRSVAHVFPIDSLSAFSSQLAKIFYYKHVNDKTGYSIDSASVLQMKW